MHHLRVSVLALAALLPATASADDLSSLTIDFDAAGDGRRLASDWLLGTGGAVFAISYGLTVSVSLASDRSCEGGACNERYLSFIPIVGGVLQFAVAGKDFHDEHHTDECFPRTIAAVGGQVVGAGGVIAGLILRYASRDEPKSAVHRLSMSPETYDGAGFGFTVGLTGI